MNNSDFFDGGELPPGAFKSLGCKKHITGSVGLATALRMDQFHLAFDDIDELIKWVFVEPGRLRRVLTIINMELAIL
jgi:hypothetical protein